MAARKEMVKDSEISTLQEVEKRWTKLADELVIPFFVELGISRDAVDQF